MYSVIIPVYKNEQSIHRLVSSLDQLSVRLNRKLEAVFVVDGSPDKSYELLRKAIENTSFPAQLLLHSRNFGSFPAIRTGLESARGEFYAVMAADLQEPMDLVIDFFRALEGDECDVAIGTRTGRNDPMMSKVASSIFWGLYKRLIVPEMPDGGVDIFGCNRSFRNQLLKLEESRSSLIALVFWLGFRRQFFSYERLEREEGKSSWTFRKKIDYMLDSIFAFTDYPIRLLLRIGIAGSILSAVLGATVLVSHLAGAINVPGYAATMLMILFFGALNLLGLGLVGTYAWRGYENTKRRPLAITSMKYINQVNHND